MGYLSAISRKPNAFKYGPFFKELPIVWQEYFRNSDFDDCKQLRFSVNIIENAKKLKNENNLDFLLKLFTLELENREMKRKNAYLKAAKFDVLKTFADYTFDDIKMPKSITPNEIISTGFIGKKENLILYGNVGSGKTHLAIATGIAACNGSKMIEILSHGDAR